MDHCLEWDELCENWQMRAPGGGYIAWFDRNYTALEFAKSYRSRFGRNGASSPPASVRRRPERWQQQAWRNWRCQQGTQRAYRPCVAIEVCAWAIRCELCEPAKRFAPPHRMRLRHPQRSAPKSGRLSQLPVAMYSHVMISLTACPRDQGGCLTTGVPVSVCARSRDREPFVRCMRRVGRVV